VAAFATKLSAIRQASRSFDKERK
jgi:hypothetical protein